MYLDINMKKITRAKRLWKTVLRAGLGSAILTSANFVLAAESSPTVIPNPIAAQSFPCLIQTISLAAMQVAIPIAIVTIIFAGLKFIFAGVSGNSAKVTEARKILLWAVIGTAVVVGSFVIANAAVELFGGETATVSCS